jgi:hypothetical protein
MQDLADDELPPLPPITLRGLLLANTVLGLVVSFLTTLGLGEVSLWLPVVWGAIGILFVIQWATLWLVMQFAQQPEEMHREWNDPRNSFPKLPRDR